MSKEQIAITGAGGFLGWHTRVAAHSLGKATAPIGLGTRFNEEQALQAAQSANRLIHLAGVNRADTEEEVYTGNIEFAEQLAATLRSAASRPEIVVYANSIQANNNSVYGKAKAKAGEILQAACEELGIKFENHLLPNIFGEHGQPYYNSVVATFAHQVANGEKPTVQQDPELTLLHAQDVADLLLGSITQQEAEALQVQANVSTIANLLTEFGETYRIGEIPDISTQFRRNLFNTYRSFLTSQFPQVVHTQHADERGSFVELIRTHGGTGQASFSTTAPGILRGGHYHRRKVERFTVIGGEAIIELRRMFTDNKAVVRVSGDEPVSIDMPTMWTHNIKNVGDSTLFTHFWIDEHFDPARPDTVMEDV